MTTTINNDINESKADEMIHKIPKIGKFLSDENLRIPTYQRPYKWTTKHVNQLFADIMHHKDKPSYRLGTIVLHQEKNSIEKNIVDGQQRTVTLLLTVHAVFSKKLIINDIELKKQLEELNTIFENFKATFDSDISKYNIYHNYQEISRIVSRPDFTAAIVDFLLNKCEVVTFTLKKVSEAFQFFDSQNARGRDLDPHDLLKSYHLREFNDENEQLKIKTITHWESHDSKELAEFFEKYMYRSRNWIRGNPARHFTKNDIKLFKGVNIRKTKHYPFTEFLRITHHYVDNYNHQYERNIDGYSIIFPFQLDQTIINGRRFFEMVQHYQKKIKMTKEIIKYKSIILEEHASIIVKKINNYPDNNRKGDEYVRSLFDTILMYYMDKFGTVEISRAIEKIFIWSYRLRLEKKAIQMATINSHVLENNMFKHIRESTHPEDFLNLPFSRIRSDNLFTNAQEITVLFEEMGYK